MTYAEDILVGYRWHDTKKIPARYAFGHGLSYTTFDYGKPEVSSGRLNAGEGVHIRIPVTNTGTRDGMEVVQLYIGDDRCSVMRPLKELKHFKKVLVKAGESVDVEFTITEQDLRFYDETTRSWVAEAGTFKAYVGSSSSDIRRVVPFRY